MTEEQAIERVTDAMMVGINNIYDRRFVEKLAYSAWNEIKAIAREDALTLHLPAPADAPNKSVTAWNRDGKSLSA